ncbi:MAG: histidine--tRNA ligase [Candidatus Aminicenantes bacterium]|nr:histidine--tRNA ligase [Candidatus Aminicenantes bacterium]MDH5383233.1 histidine--tRNA ligase [Candidatus Aminicenantes bacterium]MDH5745323.1 histidine--tRNA ligase [Candidatus Aminicenantes bacterium]
MSKKEKKVAAIKGTKDILPQEARKWQKVEAVAKGIFELYGYREIRTPIFEATELFEKGTGQTTDIVIKEMYTFKDKGGRSLTLRPEYTPSIVRSIIEHRLYLQTQPLRLYFIGPMFRYDKPQKGRYRQFHQMDIEVFGEKDPAIDAEIVEMADYLLEKLKVKNKEILVNSVGCRKCRPTYHKDLRASAKKVREKLCEDCQRKIDTNPLRIFDCKVETCREATLDFPDITDYLCGECQGHFDKFCSYLYEYGIGYRIEPRLVRGLDYYTKTTFEIVSSKLGAQDAILGGGRYDDMMKDFGGPDMCAIGFAVGMERLLSLVPYQEEKQDFVYFVCLGDEARDAGMKLARFLRGEGVECLIEYKERSLRNQMSRADKLDATWALVIGEDEVAKGTYQLKRMDTGEQRECTQAALLKILRESTS